jgi:hypothetical protein
VILRHDRLGIEIPAGDPDLAGAMPAYALKAGKVSIQLGLWPLRASSSGDRRPSNDRSR